MQTQDTTSTPTKPDSATSPTSAQPARVIVMRSGWLDVLIFFAGIVAVIIICGVSWYMSALQTANYFYGNQLARCYVVDGAPVAVNPPKTSTDKEVDNTPSQGKAK